MNFEHILQKLAYLDRFGHWKWLKTPVVGVGASEIGALWAQVDWMHVFPALGLAITAIGTAVIGLWRYYRLSAIEILIKEREAESILRPAPIVVTPHASPDVADPPKAARDP